MAIRFGSSDFNSNKPTGALTGRSKQTSGSYFQDPMLVKLLSQMGGRNAARASGDYFNFIQDPTGSSLYQNTLSGALQAMQPSITEGADALRDEFRRSGALQSGAYGTSLGNYYAGVNRNQNELASSVLANMFPQMTQALWNPMSQATSLMEALKLNRSKGTSQQFSDRPEVDPNVMMAAPGQRFTGTQSTQGGFGQIGPWDPPAKYYGR